MTTYNHGVNFQKVRFLARGQAYNQIWVMCAIILWSYIRNCAVTVVVYEVETGFNRNETRIWRVTSNAVPLGSVNTQPNKMVNVLDFFFEGLYSFMCVCKL